LSLRAVLKTLERLSHIINQCALGGRMLLGRLEDVGLVHVAAFGLDNLGRLEPCSELVVR
jgi:hypothetical protein